MPPRQRDEHVLERRAVRRQQAQRRARARAARRAAPARRGAPPRSRAPPCRLRAGRRVTPGSARSSSSAGSVAGSVDGELDHVLGAERGDERRRRPERNQLPVVHDADAIAERVRLVHVVRRDQRWCRRSRNRSSTPHSCRRDCGSRPVVGSSRNSRSGRPAMRARDRQPLLLAAGQLPDPGVALRSSSTVASSSSTVGPSGRTNETAAASRRRSACRRAASPAAECPSRVRSQRPSVPSAGRALRRRRHRRRAGPRESRSTSSCRRRWVRADRSTRRGGRRGRGRRPPRRRHTA